MKIWLVQANEPIAFIDKNQRLFRTGLLANELEKRNHIVNWFTASFDHYTKKQRCSKNKTLKINSHYFIEMIWTPCYHKNISIRRIINHKYMAVRFRKRINHMELPDIIYCSFPTIELAEECISFGLKHNIPVITDIRDLWPDIFEQNLKSPFNILVKPYVKLMDIKTKKIFRNSYALNGVSDKALSWGLNKIKRVVNKNDYFYFIGYKKREINHLYKSDKILILEKDLIIPFVGTIGNQINYRLIIEIATKLKESNIKIIICGDGPQLATFKKEAKHLRNIIFLGWIDANDIDYVLSNAFLGLIPYNNTFDFQMGAGNKFGEYLSYSLPVIVTCQGVMEKLVKEYDCGIMSLNAEEIVCFIKKAERDHEFYKVCRDNAKLLYNKELNSEIIYSKVADYLEKIIE